MVQKNQTYFLYLHIETLKNNFLYQIKRCDYKQFDFIRWISKQLKHKKNVPDLKKFVQMHIKIQFVLNAVQN